MRTHRLSMADLDAPLRSMASPKPMPKPKPKAAEPKAAEPKAASSAGVLARVEAQVTTRERTVTEREAKEHGEMQSIAAARHISLQIASISSVIAEWPSTVSAGRLLVVWTGSNERLVWVLT